MLSFKLNTEQTRTLLRLYDETHKNASFLSTLEAKAKAYMHRQVVISVVGSSTRIENALLTNPEIDWVDTLLATDAKPTSLEHFKEQIQNKLGKDKKRSIEEVAGCRNMLKLIYSQRQQPTEFLIRSLHYELMRYDSRPGLVKGGYKENPNSVAMRDHDTGEKRVVFQTAPAGVETQMAMRDLFEWYPKTIQIEAHPLPVIVEFIYRFLAIHPFQDGNGRMGRALFILLLLRDAGPQLAEVIPYLAIDRHIEKYKPEYYISLAQTSKGRFKRDPKEYKFQFFFDYILKIMIESLDDVKFYAQRFKAYDALSSPMKNVLNCFQQHPEIALQARHILQRVDVSRDTLTYCLRVLVQKKFLYRRGQKAGTHYELIF